MAHKYMMESYIRIIAYILSCKLYGSPQIREFIVIYNVNVN